jgi:phosphatidylglycerol:prolipoprotein diacylglycerol transferase
MDITFQSIFLGGFSIGPLDIGSLEIRFYSIMILSGLLAGVLLAQREAQRIKENPDHVINIAVLGAVLALIGARLYHVIDKWAFYSQNPGRIVAIWNGGIGIYGAIAGAAFGLLAYVWWVNQRERKLGRRGKPVDALRWLDIGAPAFLLGQAIGRWGNYFNHELFGPPSDLPWAIRIPTEQVLVEAPRYAGEATFHPLFLYESLLSLMGVLLLVYIARRLSHRLRKGDILALYFVWYPTERFFLEFLRSENWKLGALPTAQVLGVLLVLASIAWVVYRHRMRVDASEEDAAAEVNRASRSNKRRQRRRTEPQSNG